MSSITQPQTFKDLYTDLMNRTREDTSVSATAEQAKRYINIALYDMHVGQGEKYPWAERHGQFNTHPPYSTGTVSVTQGSTTVTSSGAAFDSSNSVGGNNVEVGNKIIFSGQSDVYEVLNISGSGTVLTLTHNYIGTTLTDATYTTFKDEYTLATDFLRPVDQQRFDSECSIDLVGRTEFRRRYPANRITGTPHIGTIIDRTFDRQDSADILVVADQGGGLVNMTVSSTAAMTSGDDVVITGTTSYNGTHTTVFVASTPTVYIKADFAGTETGAMRPVNQRERRIVLHPPPSAAKLFRYAYVTSYLAVGGVFTHSVEKRQLVADEDEPIVPIQYRHAIVFHALSHWYRDKKDDARSQEAANEYTNLMLRVINDTEVGDVKAQIRPRVGTYRARARTPWRGGTRRYDLNGRFDRLE